MKLSRRGKTIRNLLLAPLLILLLCAQRDFQPLTAGGMCRQMGRQLMMTTPEPVYVLRESRPRYEHTADTFVIARSGPTWLSFRYEASDLHLWEFSWRTGIQVENGPILTAFRGTLYLAGDLPPEAVTARGTATARHITVWHDGDGNREPPEYGESRDFPLEGSLLKPGVFALPYSTDAEMSWLFEEPPEEEQDLAYAAHEWYSILLRSPEPDGSRGVLHADVPISVTLYDAAGQPLETYQFLPDNYDLSYS